MARMDAADPPITRAALERASGVSRKTLREYLDGVRVARRDTIIRLERGLGWPAGTADRYLYAESRTAGNDLHRSDDSPVHSGEKRSDLLNLIEEAVSDLPPTQRAEVEAAAFEAALRRRREITGG